MKTGQEVLVYQDGELIARARYGRLVFWRDQRKLQVYVIDLREETLDVVGQEIMTSDKVTLRVNLAVTYRVVEVQKEAEANLIRRREETAVARSQANTARLLAQNPVLARMKELEALQDVLAGAKATVVLGRGDLPSQLRTLIDPDGSGEATPD